VGDAPVPVLPSPKSQLKVIGSPSGSFDPLLENCTVRGAKPPTGLAEATAVGGVLPDVNRIRRTSLALMAT
jgi:hypothetical protein